MNELSVLSAAEEAPSRDCLVAGGVALSYAEVADRVRVAIAVLRDAGVEGGDRVALTPQADLDSLLWLFAAFEIGCPTVLLHPRLTERERQAVLEHGDPALVISQAVPADSAAVPAGARSSVPSNRPLAILQTSGTGGQPRLAVLSRRAFVASAAAHAANLPWRTDDRWLLSMPPAHVGGLSILTRCLIARRCVVLDPGPFDPGATIRTLGEHRVTLLSVVPTMLQRLLGSRDPVWTAAPPLRAVLVGGAPLPEALREAAVERSIPVLATYGCTEACSQVATQAPGQSGLPGSGRPLPGIELRIEAGEIQLRGDVLMDGYLGEERRGDRWAPDAWFRTGDLGCFLADGQLEVHGRIDDLIITGGENVSPSEVEAFLCAVPGVTAAGVFGLSHDAWGQEVVAALVTEPDRFDRQALGARLRRGLAPHKRPKRVCLVAELPLSRSGKVDRRALATRCRDELEEI